MKDAEPRSFAEILAPVREQFAASGMTEEELDALIEEVREEIWKERRRKVREPREGLTPDGP